MGEQRVGDLPRRAGHAYPQDLLRRHASAIRLVAQLQRPEAEQGNPCTYRWNWKKDFGRGAKWNDVSISHPVKICKLGVIENAGGEAGASGEWAVGDTAARPRCWTGASLRCWPSYASTTGASRPAARPRMRRPPRLPASPSHACSGRASHWGAGGGWVVRWVGGVVSYSRHAADLAEKAANKKDGLALDADDVAVRTPAPHARSRSPCTRRARPHVADGRWVCRATYTSSSPRPLPTMPRTTCTSCTVPAEATRGP